MASLEIQMLKRRIIRVIDYFDETDEVPWNYIERSGDGRFEAFVTVIVNNNPCRALSLGIFDDCEAAVRAVRSYLCYSDVLERMRS
jgi:hypothetical protein